MTGIYIKRNAVWSWAAGTENTPVSEAGYPVLDDWTVDPELRDVLGTFDGGSIYALFEHITGKRMAGSFAVPLFQQPTIATVPPVYGALLRACGMEETDSGSTFIYAAASPKFATDDVPGVTYPKNLRLNIDNHLLPLFTNAVGNVAFELVAPGLPLARFDWLGQRATAYNIDAAQTAMTYPVHPVPVGSTTINITRNAPAVTGTATGTGTTTLTDSAATFLSRGVQPGDVVTNSTDGSTGGGVVTAVTSETTLTHTALTGGSGNDWQVNDEYSIAAGAPVIARCTRLFLPLGNVLSEQPGIGGVNGFYQPRIIDRSQALYTLELEMPVRTDFDWQREIDTASGDPSRSLSFSVIHNSGGAAGSVLTWSFTAKPVGKAAISNGNAGQLMLGLSLRQHYASGPLTLVVS